MNCDVIFGSVGLLECPCVAVPSACARAVGVKRSQRKALISGASPGPGAVTTLCLPDPASIMPVPRVTPDREPGYGVKVEKTSGAVPDADGRLDEKTFTCDSIPGPEPTMMLSAIAFPSMSAPATVTPPVKPESYGANRVGSVLNTPSTVLLPS